MPDTLTLEELSRRTGEGPDRLLDWQSRGIIGLESGRQFSLEDVEKVRVIELFLRRGVSMDALAKAVKAILDTYRDFVSTYASGRTYTLDEAAVLLGIERQVLEHFWDATAIGMMENVITEEELELLRGVKLSIDSGLPEETLAQLVRVYADALGRVAVAEQRLFRAYMEARVEAGAVSGPDLMRDAQVMTERLLPLTDPVILYFHRLGLLKAVREDLMVDLAREIGLIKETEAPGQVTRAIAFVDLSSFTPMTENMGDVKAAEVLERFSHLVRDTLQYWGGRVTKQIGDAFMLVFPDAGSGVAALLDIESRATAELSFPAVRAGLHWGPALSREGDYLGTTVNIAARLADEATRHQVLVTADVRREAAGLQEVEFRPAGRRQLKGIAGDVEVFEAARSGSPGERLVDPVCGLDIAPAEVAADLKFEGKRLCFCSPECLRQFVAAPDRYVK